MASSIKLLKSQYNLCIINIGILYDFLSFEFVEDQLKTVSYKKLWHLLLDKNMKKKDLQEAAGLTQYAMLKLGRDEDVSTEILGKICQALECSPEEIMEFVSSDN